MPFFIYPSVDIFTKKTQGMRTNHEIDFRIVGEEMQYVEIELDPNETAIAESGSFMMMDDGIQMTTILGDGSQQNSGGLLGKLLGAGKRLLVGESLFMTAFSNVGSGKKKVSFASPYPGKIIPLDLQELGGRSNLKLIIGVVKFQSFYFVLSRRQTQSSPLKNSVSCLCRCSKLPFCLYCDIILRRLKRLYSSFQDFPARPIPLDTFV